MRRTLHTGLLSVFVLAFLIGGPSFAQTVEVDIVDIPCESVQNGTLTTTDTLAPNNVLGLSIPDNVRLDFYRFQGETNKIVDIELTSNDFVPAVALIDTSGDPDDLLEAFFADIDIPQSGNTARVVYQLDRTGPWGIVVANWPGVTGDPGSYSLSLKCDVIEPLPPQLNPPSNLTAASRGTQHVELQWTDNSGNEDGFLIESEVTSGNWEAIASAPRNAEHYLFDSLMPSTAYTFRVVASSNTLGDSTPSNVDNVITEDLGEIGSCTESSTATCTNGARFKVEVAWEDFSSNTGSGQALASPAADSALFYFFSDDNIELVAKVIDGCSVNDHYWFFAAAATTVAYEITVTDTADGNKRLYGNALGTRSPAFEDVKSFANCP